ncbi:MAG: autotransporter-associated beta strand repeat-containing protein [Methylacidiphilales bacterium]|nr:autotransporter-associated beta strand repeat-containing protein [Candidatus Methylacidiphilales bacterium]
MNGRTIASSITGGSKLTISGTLSVSFRQNAYNNTMTLAGTGDTLVSARVVDWFSTGGSGVGVGSYNITNTGITTFSGTNNIYGGTTTLGDGSTLAVAYLADGGMASSTGTSSAAAANLAITNATLRYIGGTASTNRGFTIGAGAGTTAALNASGAGAVSFTNTASPVYADTNLAKTLILTGTNTGLNTLAASIADNGTGAVSLTKDGIGTWVLSGVSTYSGNTTISGGKLQLGADDTTSALSALSAIVDNGIFAVNRSNDVAQGTDFSSTAITGTGQFVQAGTGKTTLNAANAFTGDVSVQKGILAFNSVAAAAGAQALGSGSMVYLGVTGSSAVATLDYTGAAGTLDKNIYAMGSGLNTVRNSGGGLLILSGSLQKNGTVLVLNGNTGGIKVTGVISGTSANSDLYVTGGTTTLAAANTYNGPTWVYGGGTLVSGIDNALPTNTTLVLGGTNGGTDNSSNTFDLGGHNQSIVALNSMGSGTQTVINSGASVSTLAVTDGGTYSGVIANGNGTTALSLSGGNLVLGGTNTYTGATLVTGGTLSVNGSLAAGSAVSVNSATLTGSGKILGTVSGTSATINGNDLTIGATTLHDTSAITGKNTVDSITIATGTTTLTGTTKSIAALVVSVGATLNANGTVDGSATINGILKGNTTLTGDLALIGGTLSPGNSAGITTVEGNFTMDATSTLVAEVTGTTAGLTYDQVKVSQNVSLAGTLDLRTLSGLTLVGTTITLIDNIDNGSTTGYFETILTSGSTFTLSSDANYKFSVDGADYLLSFKGNSEGDSIFNDVTLTLVPEPATWAMFVGGLGMLAFGQRLRRKQS